MEGVENIWDNMFVIVVMVEDGLHKNHGKGTAIDIKRMHGCWHEVTGASHGPPNSPYRFANRESMTKIADE